MRHPFVLALAAGLVVLLAAFAAPLWHMLRAPAPQPASTEAPVAQGLPWQTEVAADGALQVFGIAVGRATLAEAEARFGDALQVALVGRLGEPPALEALVDPHQAGFVNGRLVLAFEAAPVERLRWQSQASDSSPMEGGARRFTLRAEDRAQARQAVLRGLSFLPTVRLSEDDVRQRFGPAEAELAQPGDAKVLLYPARGLAATVAAGQRGVLQYVAPRDFESRLRAPLQAAAASR